MITGARFGDRLVATAASGGRCSLECHTSTLRAGVGFATLATTNPFPESMDDFAAEAELVDSARVSHMRGRREPGSESGLVRAWRPYRPGGVIAGKYRMERTLWEGELLCVIQARHLVLQQAATVKYLRPEARAFPEKIANFLHSSKLVLQLRTEHVAPVLDVGVLELGTPYLALERPAGLPLSQICQVRGALPVQEALFYVRQACRGLAQAHALGLHHGGLSTDNVIVGKRHDGTPVVRVADLGGDGISTPLGAMGHEYGVHTEDVPAYLRYLSPDHMRTPDRIDARADVWAVGAILYEALVGVPAFADDTASGLLAVIAADHPMRPTAFRNDISDALEGIILRCLEKDRARRFSDCGALLSALSALEGQAATPTPPHVSRRPSTSPPPAATSAYDRRPGNSASPPREWTAPASTAPASQRPVPAHLPSRTPSSKQQVLTTTLAWLGVISGGMALLTVLSLALFQSNSPLRLDRSAETAPLPPAAAPTQAPPVEESAPRPESARNLVRTPPAAVESAPPETAPVAEPPATIRFPEHPQTQPVARRSNTAASAVPKKQPAAPRVVAKGPEDASDPFSSF